MFEDKLKEIRNFCESNSSAEIKKKYSRYFKGDFDGYGIEQKLFKAQRDKWIEEWKSDMTLEKYLDLSDILMQTGKYEEKKLFFRHLLEQCTII